MNKFLNTFTTGKCEEVLKELPDESVDLIFTDPPYNVSQKKKSIHNICRHKDVNFDYGEWDVKFNPLLFLRQSLRVLNPQGSLIVWTSDHLFSFYRKWMDRYMYFKGMLFWHKTNAVLQFRKIAYRNSVEMMLWASKQAITKNNSNFIFHKQEEMTNIFHAPVVMGKERTAHPTQKSLYVCKKIIERHCRKGGIVLDPFSGSGSISVAAYSLGRNFIGIEKDQKWNEIAKQRIKEYQIKVEEHTDKFEQIKF